MSTNTGGSMSTPDARSIAWPAVHGTLSDARSTCEGPPGRCTRTRQGLDVATAGKPAGAAAMGQEHPRRPGREPPPPRHPLCCHHHYHHRWNQTRNTSHALPPCALNRPSRRCCCRPRRTPRTPELPRDPGISVTVHAWSTKDKVINQ